MSLRALPTIAIRSFSTTSWCSSVGGAAEPFFRAPLFTLQMIKGAQWSFSREISSSS